jgi:hypothetical protein
MPQSSTNPTPHVVLHRYGALEVMLRERTNDPRHGGLTPSMLFKIDPQYEREVRPWVELLNTG